MFSVAYLSLNETCPSRMKSRNASPSYKVSQSVKQPAYLTYHSEHLGQYQLNISDCTNINLFISSIDLFPRINAIYGKYFGASPPSRTCVAVDLPHPIRIRLDCTAFIEPHPSTRQALHVQGLSYWAPANIGPYSQAVVV